MPQIGESVKYFGLKFCEKNVFFSPSGFNMSQSFAIFGESQAHRKNNIQMVHFCSISIFFYHLKWTFATLNSFSSKSLPTMLSSWLGFREKKVLPTFWAHKNTSSWTHQKEFGLIVEWDYFPNNNYNFFCWILEKQCRHEQLTHCLQ